MADTSTPTSVSYWRAGMHYFRAKSLLGALGTVSFLGKHAVSLAGGNLETFPIKFDEFSTFSCNAGNLVYQLPEIGKTVHGAVRRVWQGCQVLSGTKSLETLSKEENGEVPTEGNRYFGAKYLVASSLMGGLFKTASCAIVLYEASKGVGILNKKVNPKLSAIGSGFDIASQVINIVDGVRALIDLEKGKRCLGETGGTTRGLEADEQQLQLNRYSIRARWFDVAISGLMIGVGAVEIADALHNAERIGLLGRVTHFAYHHSENLVVALSNTVTMLSFAKYVLYGASIQELEKCDVNKG